MAPNKIFVISTGPPGSGKGSKLHCLYSLFHIHKASKPYMSIIDNYVERDATYTSQMHALIHESGGAAHLKTIFSLPARWHAQNKFTRAASALYHDARYRTNATEKTDRDTLAALRNERPIAVLETTGAPSTMKWLCTQGGEMIEVAKKHGYTVVLMYPYVAQDTLLMRNTTRFFKQLQAGTGPRLAPKNIIINGIARAQQGIVEAMSYTGCIDAILILDNESSGVAECKVMLFQDMREIDSSKAGNKGGMANNVYIAKSEMKGKFAKKLIACIEHKQRK